MKPIWAMNLVMLASEVLTSFRDIAIHFPSEQHKVQSKNMDIITLGTYSKAFAEYFDLLHVNAHYT